MTHADLTPGDRPIGKGAGHGWGKHVPQPRSITAS